MAKKMSKRYIEEVKKNEDKVKKITEEYKKEGPLSKERIYQLRSITIDYVVERIEDILDEDFYNSTIRPYHKEEVEAVVLWLLPKLRAIKDELEKEEKQ